MKLCPSAAFACARRLADSPCLFRLWPGSHRQCYHHMETEINMEPRDGYPELLASIKANTTPVEIAGEAGDCCFWHPRAVHSGGV